MSYSEMAKIAFQAGFFGGFPSVKEGIRSSAAGRVPCSTGEKTALQKKPPTPYTKHNEEWIMVFGFTCSNIIAFYSVADKQAGGLF